MAKKTDDLTPAAGVTAALNERLTVERREAQRTYERFVVQVADGRGLTAAELDTLAALRPIEQSDADFGNDAALLKQLRGELVLAYRTPEMEAAEMAASLERERKFKA